ncbi:hypothetical protein GCM10025858_26230 [Alicyclobacillus sacchari]|nr:hypothetical protein GCM10025858_26230 [Alicyclobacillus sacchari]
MLEEEGKLRRSHGGAVKIDEETPSETSYLIRESEHVPEKEMIARLAVRYIEPGDRVILDASTTALHLASIIPDMPLTVLTNSVKIALEMSGKDKVEVISTGEFYARVLCLMLVPWLRIRYPSFMSTKRFCRVREYTLSMASRSQTRCRRSSSAK